MLRTLLVPCVVFLVGLPLVHAQPPAIPAPGPEHKLLARDVGVWKVEMKLWMAGPDADPVEAEGMETNKLVKNGFWLDSQFEGDMFGQKMTGGGQYGYDPVKKKYVGTWTDSMSPHLSVMEGEYDAASKTLTYVTRGIDPMTQQPSQGKIVAVYKDDDHRTMTMYSPLPGQDGLVKTMELKYTRKE
jgi:hypothetical protein